MEQMDLLGGGRNTEEDYEERWGAVWPLQSPHRVLRACGTHVHAEWKGKEGGSVY